MSDQNNIKQLREDAEELRRELAEANDTLEAIRTGQIDALIVQKDAGHELYTLQSADQAYRIFIERMTEGAITLNAEGVILYCNSSFAEMVNTEISAVIGVKLRDFIEPRNAEAYDELFAKCMKEDCKAETILSPENNAPLQVQLSFASITKDKGQVISVIVTDLSGQKKTQATLEENNRALEMSNRDLMRFASVASHDLQEPVRKIQIFSRLLQENENRELSDESKKYLGKIISSATRMKALIVDMLDYSRLTNNDAVLKQVNLDEVLKEVNEDLELSIAEHKTEIVSAELPTITANRGQMRQVFQNIISNSIKFSRPGMPARICISVKRIAERSLSSREDKKGAYFLIGFKDNGIGFNEKYAGNIFELFERLNTKDAYEGTGIGLAIAKKIVENHHGLIAAKGKENEGAEFLIILPAV